MSRMPAISFEMLRGGPPHNQLLSPITEYLALCGDAAPYSFRLPFEHRDLLDRLQLLRYDREDRDEARRAELYRLGRDIGGILGDVPSFNAELSGLRPDGDELVHLRLVFNGNELGIVPWEAAQVPAGLRGAGLPLQLHPDARVTLTREVRGAARRRFNWDQKPRILFAYAAASDFPLNTVEAHMLALRRAVEPWAYTEWLTNGWRIDYPIDVIENASIAAIREKCATTKYTHVHILAHGARLGDSSSRYGLYLHDRSSAQKREIVGGEQLAHALRACGLPPHHSDPLLVSLASCDSANQASVETPGGSVAHELHHHGIPWAIASQFPLTVTGSVILVEDLYARLLRGEDPRDALHCIRTNLAARFRDRHDWATLVAYASLPNTFDADVTKFCRRAAIAQRDRAYVLGDLLVLKRLLPELDAASRLANFIESKRKNNEIPEPADARGAMQRAEHAFERVVSTIRQDEPGTAHADDLARQGAMVKRLAEQTWLDAPHSDAWRTELRRARDLYAKGSTAQNTLDHWAIGQRLVLDTVLHGAQAKLESDFGWHVAYNAALLQTGSTDAAVRMWANSTLADLLMVAIEHEAYLPGQKRRKARSDDVEKTLETMAGDGEAAVWTTFRQFWRYRNWWRGDKWNDAAEQGFRFLLGRVERGLARRALDEAQRASATDRTEPTER